MKRLFPNPNSEIPKIGNERENAAVGSSASGMPDNAELRDVLAGGERWNRRSFLKTAGFAFAGAAVGCDRGPAKYAIPHLVQPEETTPGRSIWYSSMCGGCEARCGILGRVRDGRPVKIEGNAEHPVSKGGLCAIGQAMILGLYDAERLAHPMIRGKEAGWPEVDRLIAEKLANAKRVRILAGSMMGMTERKCAEEFLARFEDGKLLRYDPLSVAAILDTHVLSHGRRVLPRYRFDRADLIVGIDADFLGTWISPVEFAAGYSTRRKPDPEHGAGMSRHVHLESRVSLTGSNADVRKRIAPGEVMPLLEHLAARLAGGAAPSAGISSVPEAFIDGLATELGAAKGKSLLVCGANERGAQVLANRINEALGNYRATLDIDSPSFQKEGDDDAPIGLLSELESGTVDALFVHGVNPVYDHPFGERFAVAIKKAGLTVSFADRIDETSACAEYKCPSHHPLEAWNDAETVADLMTIAQPLIAPLKLTRAFTESLACWSGSPRGEYEIIRASWKERIFQRRKDSALTFETFWNRTVHDGFAELKAGTSPVAAIRPMSSAAHSSPNHMRPATGELALVLYPKLAMLDGRHAHNPWLHELPDPVTKVTWDNYASLSPAVARRAGVNQGDVIRVSSRVGSVELPVFIQAGQHDEIVAVALGYGRQGTDRFARIGPQWFESNLTVEEGATVGKNAARFLEIADHAIRFAGMPVRIEKTGRSHALAATQRHHTLDIKSELGLAGGEPLPLIREMTLAALLAPGNDGHTVGSHDAAAATLWSADHASPGHKWAMAIDLSACTGCSGCVIGCQAENNIPIVGKDEVMRAREMHWIRIDRYYSGPDDDLRVAHQPMLCHHCGNAPCETVCPVLATVHSAEGLNQQVYNRCVGTRYCANNCPVKTRRFNWFDYPHHDKLKNMALNPDVTVRTRGVMEKCSFCVQRIMAAKAESTRHGVKIADGDISPACVQSCPARAIVFGDLNDPASAISRARAGSRHFTILDELNLDAAVGYRAKVRNHG